MKKRKKYKCKIIIKIIIKIVINKKIVLISIIKVKYKIIHL